MEHLIVVEDLWKTFRVGDIEFPALRGVDTHVDKGEFVAIVGPSGSGKSTLLHIVGGLDSSTRGRVIVNDVDISKLNSDKLAEYRNRDIGFIFQFFNLIPYLTAVENVEISSAIANVSRKTRRAKAIKLLELFNLAEKTLKKPTELSGGEQQRVAIARALINDPILILADEPTGNVDSETGQVVIEAFRKSVENFGTTVLMVTHDTDLPKYCDRTIMLKDGKIIEEVA
ncbi:ABC transporter ATP-binding protein [Candidatus Bathyarchaeota archaeon]|jgi:putative ABC transport system ATP-binding protein|nr:MAG: ABC transporter ATP-binding protein [Candidatus Bathyarchaeota archaeon]